MGNKKRRRPEEAPGKTEEMKNVSRKTKLIIGAITILPIWLGLWAGSFLVMIKLWEAL